MSCLKETDLLAAIQAPFFLRDIASSEASVILAPDVAQQDADGTRSNNSVRRLILPCPADVANQPPPAAFHVLAGTLWRCNLLLHAHKNTQTWSRM